jgi:hypothetical protein
MKIWVTDGSGVPFSDIAPLPAYHHGTWGGEVPYKGALDENAPVGEATLFGDGPSSVLIPEAEWCICFPTGTDSFVTVPDSLTESTPIVMQGMIEGKWLNLFDENLAFKPASLGNNLLARGPGIPGTLGSLDDGGMRGEVRVQHDCRAGRKTYTATLDDLRGHNLLGLARAVFSHCREHGLTVEAVDCSARGPRAALVEDAGFLQQVLTAARLTHDDQRVRRLGAGSAPRLAKVAGDEVVTIEPGAPVDLVVTAGSETVGQGQLTLM